MGDPFGFGGRAYRRARVPRRPLLAASQGLRIFEHDGTRPCRLEEDLGG